MLQFIDLITAVPLRIKNYINIFIIYLFFQLLCVDILYQELPPEIVSLPVTSESGNTVNKFLFNTLPLSDSVHADEELHKAVEFRFLITLIFATICILIY